MKSTINQAIGGEGKEIRYLFRLEVEEVSNKHLIFFRKFYLQTEKTFDRNGIVNEEIKEIFILVSIVGVSVQKNHNFKHNNFASTVLNEIPPAERDNSLILFTNFKNRSFYYKL